MNFWQTITRPVIGLAPMDGVTDAAFRYIAAKHGGPDVILTEFVNIQSALYSPHTLLQDFAYSEIERPVVAQIYGKTPELFYQVAHIVCELGFDGLDINMGCPAKKVAAIGCGAALIRHARPGAGNYSRGEAGSARLVYRSEPRRLKSSRRYNRGHRPRQPQGAPARARPTSAGGFRYRSRPGSVTTGSSSTIGYGRCWKRSRRQFRCTDAPWRKGYKGDADWHSIARAVEFARGSASANSGQRRRAKFADAHRRIRETHVDGVLIGRGAQGDPWLFREKDRVKEALAIRS